MIFGLFIIVKMRPISCHKTRFWQYFPCRDIRAAAVDPTDTAALHRPCLDVSGRAGRMILPPRRWWIPSPHDGGVGRGIGRGVSRNARQSKETWPSPRPSPPPCSEGGGSGEPRTWWEYQDAPPRRLRSPTTLRFGNR